MKKIIILFVIIVLVFMCCIHVNADNTTAFLCNENCFSNLVVKNENWQFMPNVILSQCINKIIVFNDSFTYVQKDISIIPNNMFLNDCVYQSATSDTRCYKVIADSGG